MKKRIMRVDRGADAGRCRCRWEQAWRGGHHRCSNHKPRVPVFPWQVLKDKRKHKVVAATTTTMTNGERSPSLGRGSLAASAFFLPLFTKCVEE